jgi:hypothetical protein
MYDTVVQDGGWGEFGTREGVWLDFDKCYETIHFLLRLRHCQRACQVTEVRMDRQNISHLI